MKHSMMHAMPSWRAIGPTQPKPTNPPAQALRTLAISAVVTFAPCVAAVAAEGSPWTLQASQSLVRDDNLYRLADGVAAPLGTSRADTVATTTLGAGWDGRIGRQRLQADASVRAIRHADNDALDHHAHDLRLTWLAQTAGRLGGVLSLRRARQLRTPDNLIVASAAVRNLETDEAVGGVIRLGGEGRLTVEAGLGARQRDLSVPTAGSATLRSRTVSAGARWRPGAATTLGAALRHTAGRYPVLDEDWRLDAVDLSAEWDRGGRTSLWARLSPVRLRHDRFTQRDVAGLNVAGQLRWQASPKIDLALRLQREIGTDIGLERWDQSAGAVWPGTGDDARLVKRIALDLSYAMTAKLKLTAGATHTRRDLVPLSASTPNAAFGEDRTSRVAAGASWQASTRVSLGCEAAAERRAVDGALSAPYTARSVGCVAQVRF
jgi:hypothetical protein